MQKKKYQLFFLPFAGGNATVYNKILRKLSHDIEAHVIEYPGHGRRTEEQFAESMHELAEDAANQINVLINKKKQLAVFGYSMGTVIGYELIAGGLINNNVSHFFAAAQEDLKINSIGNNARLVSNEEIIAHAIKLGGVDERLKADERFLQAFLKPMIKDYHLRMDYKPNLTCRLSCDVTVMYSEQDTPYDTISGWKEITSGDTEFYCFDGDHFFMKRYPDRIADIIQKKLRIAVK